MTATILLVNETSTSSNQGCQLTSSVLRRLLRCAYPNAQIDYSFLTLTNRNWRGTSGRRFLNPNATLAERASVIRQARDPELQHFWRQICAADEVIINGEGSIIEAQPNSLFIMTVCWIAADLGKPCHLINFTGHLTSELAQRIAREAFACCKTVSVREPVSYFGLRDLCEHLQLFPDAGLILDPPVGPCPESGILLGGGSATKRMPPQELKAVAEVYSAIIGEASQRHMSVRLLGFSGDEWLKELAGGGATYERVDYRNYVETARRARVNFTGRHHGIVMSAVAGCPFGTTTANSFKNYGDHALYGGSCAVQPLEMLRLEPLREFVFADDEIVGHWRSALEARVAALKPYAWKVIENTKSRTGDLVDAGLVSLDSELLAYRQLRGAGARAEDWVS